MSEFTIFTITDHAFAPGVAGLVNSLRAAGFDGPIVIGTPERLPVLDGVADVRQVVLDDEPMWIGFLKPALLLREAADAFVYLDSDVVVDAPATLSRLARLANHGPVLALEGLVAPTDHRRLRWSARLGGPSPRPDAWAYYNGGFLAGRMPRDRALMERWRATMQAVLTDASAYGRDEDFPLGDQDALNAMVQTWTDPVVSIQFPDWWSAVAPLNPFLHVGGLQDTAFYHCIGPKPWNLRAVPPRGPTRYESLWFRHAALEPHPLRVPCDLPSSVSRWLAGSPTGRLTSRARRLRQRLTGW